jgi:Protein involved in initiation of plasmid replication
VVSKDSIAVRQANALAKSGQELDLIEKRLLLIAMSRIGRADTELLTHRISVTDLAPIFGGDPWRAAQKAAHGLLKRVVYIEGENGAFTAFQWTTLARYVPAEQSESGASYLEIRLNEELSPYLLELKERFNVIPLLDILPMGSVNSQRLYEVLWHDSFKGKNSFLTYSLKRLRFLLGLRTRKVLKGKEVWVEKYNSWRDFQKVLKRAQRDFEKNGRLEFDYEGLTEGRTTTKVRFKLSLKKGVTLPLTDDTTLQLRIDALAQTLMDAGYQQDPYAAIETHGVDVVETAVKLAHEAERMGERSTRPIYNKGGLIHHTLSSGLAERRMATMTEVQLEGRTNAREVARALVEAFESARHEVAENLWAEISEDEQRGFIGLMRLELSKFQVDQLEKAAWQGALFEASKREVILSLYPDEIPPYLQSLDAFIQEVDFF